MWTSTLNNESFILETKKFHFGLMPLKLKRPQSLMFLALILLEIYAVCLDYMLYLILPCPTHKSGDSTRHCLVNEISLYTFLVWLAVNFIRITHTSLRRVW